MESDSAESGDDSNPRNGDYNADQITEPLLACLQMITMDSENGAEFNRDQMKNLITCVIKIINILYQSLKKNTKHKERNLIKKRKRAKNAKINNSHDVIRDLCDTIKNLGGSVRDINQVEGLSCLSLAETVAGTSRTQIPAVAGTSRSNIEAIPGTSRGHREVNPGTSLSHTEAIPSTSRGHTVPERTGKSTNHITPVVYTRRGNIDVDGTPKSHVPALAGNCRNHIGVVPVTSRSNEAIPAKSRSDTDVIAVNARRQVKSTDGASRILTDTVPGASRSHINGVPEAYGSIIDAVSGNSRRHREKIARTPEKHSVTAATESYNVTIAAPETSRRQTEPIAGTSRGNTELTEVIPGNSKNHTEATARHNEEMAEASKNLQKDPGNTSGHPKPVLAETAHSNLKSVFPKTQRTLNSSLVKITNIPYGSIGEPTQELVPDIPLTQKISLEIPMDVESRRLKRKRKRNSALVKITDMDIINQAVAKKMTARSESSPNRHIEQGSAISSRTKITNTHKDAPTLSTDDSKRKLTENCALNGRTEDKPDSTPKLPTEKATPNPTPVKTSESDKENKLEDKKKRKTTKAKDSKQNAHVERVVTNSTLTNDKQATDATKKTASRPDNSDSMPNERNEETTSNSTLTKMFDTKIAEERMNGKKRKKLEKDLGSQKNTYPTSFTSDNDFDEPKASTSTFKKGNSGPPNEDKKIKDELIIDISDDTCFYNPAEEENQIMKVIQEPVPNPEDIDQVLKDQQVIDIDEDTCLYDLAQEESTITNSGPKSSNHDEISKDEQVIDLSEDTCLYKASHQKTSGANKKTSPKKECDDEIMNVEQATNSTNSIQEICRMEGENVSATSKETDEHLTELLEEREVKCAEYLLATNVKKEQASKNPGSSNTVVISRFFHAPPNQSNQKSNHKSSEQNTIHIKQRQQGTSNSLKKTHARKKPYEKSMNEKNKLKLDNIVPEVTITTKIPDSCVATSSTVIPTPKKQKTIRPSSERLTSNAPVNKPELSISELSKQPPNRPLTNSAIESILLQAVQMALPNLSITTSTASSEYRTPTMETPPAKLNPVTSKRPSIDSRPPTKRDETKPGGQQTNPVQMNANIHQNVLLPSDPSFSLNLIRQNIAKLNCRPNTSSNSSPQYRHTESRPGKPKPDSGQFSKRTKSSEQPTDSFQKKARTVPPATEETRSDSSNFPSTPAESRPEKPKPITKAAKRPTTDSGQFSKRNTHTNSSKHPTDYFEKKARTVPQETVSEASSSAIQQRAQITRPDSSNFTSTSAESRKDKTKPVATASKRPNSDSRPFPKTNTGAKPSEQPTDSFEKKARTVPPATVSETSSSESRPEKSKPVTTASKCPSSDSRPLPKTNTGEKPKQQTANSIQNGQINTSAESRPEKPKPITIAAKRPTTDSGQFSKRNTHTNSSKHPTDYFEKKARTVPQETVSEASSSAIQQRAQITRPDSSNFTSTSAESRPKPVTIASKRPSSDSRPFPKTNTGAKPNLQNATDNTIQNGQMNQVVPASSEWRPASLATLLPTSQQRTSGSAVSLSTNGLDFATRQATNPKPVSNSQSTSYAAQGSAKLASSRPKIHSAPSQNSNLNRRETTNNVQSPQIYKPVPIQNLTPNRNSGNLNSNVSKAHLDRKSSTKNHSYPIQSWHTPVLPGNESGLPQTVTSSLLSSFHQSSLPLHLLLRPPIQEQPAYQRIPTGRPMTDAVGQVNPPMHPLLVPKNQAAMMNNQKATITQPTWHIPTEATDI